jgi:hypothetical protein
MEKASSDSEVYGPEAWSGATKWWGASATSLSIAGGLITLEDLEKGQINHALAMAIPSPRAELYASPAQRTDGWVTAPDSIPEGAHLRLDPNLDLASLKLPRFTLMMAEAAQKYGIFIREHGRERRLLRTRPDAYRNQPVLRSGRLFRRQVGPTTARRLPLEPPATTEDGTAQRSLTVTLRDLGKRRHSALGMLTPNEYETLYHQQQLAA